MAGVSSKIGDLFGSFIDSLSSRLWPEDGAPDEPLRTIQVQSDSGGTDRSKPVDNCDSDAFFGGAEKRTEMGVIAVDPKGCAGDLEGAVPAAQDPTTEEPTGQAPVGTYEAFCDSEDFFGGPGVLAQAGVLDVKPKGCDSGSLPAIAPPPPAAPKF